ncbi:MAG: enoyl-CoA hydratase/isomerase family protein [Gammaproteobacteria bacterium]|nr:enoyl-CoA hydratase/isomerase family protein [Gammaproteobacteria bacterium]MBT5204628.1 enoyl-CoA hydratase/isomerase family protein [Gammaproteobacteria bacterium]MBT5601413.1 enoyl-CoA hydratase/isomerase family protein [Gammaproteobacteria bacterium]MBT6244471.1 enoyl-CoA hydratase/isomerase family protein [Gammaproteobacteria bacterium]
MNYQTIETEKRNGILILRHNRPEKLNARNSQMYVEIMAALSIASEDDEVVAVVLTAVGKFFSAGMDFENEPRRAYEVQAGDSARTAEIKRALPKRIEGDVGTWLPVLFIESFIRFDKPLIGAVNGPAIGEGFSSLLHCDLVFATASAYFWAPFARAGVAPEFCSTMLMPERLGRSLANAAIYLGHRVSAAEAKSAGFVLELFPAGEKFESAVLARIEAGLALTGPPELRHNTLKRYKRLVYQDSDREKLLLQCRKEFELIREMGRSGDTKKVQAYYQNVLPG